MKFMNINSLDLNLRNNDFGRDQLNLQLVVDSFKKFYRHSTVTMLDLNISRNGISENEDIENLS